MLLRGKASCLFSLKGRDKIKENMGGKNFREATEAGGRGLVGTGKDIRGLWNPLQFRFHTAAVWHCWYPPAVGAAARRGFLCEFICVWGSVWHAVKKKDLIKQRRKEVELIRYKCCGLGKQDGSVAPRRHLAHHTC